MHPDIDKLITLALADGEVTEKEREIILRKAEKLGLDIDEVEMYLEGKISNHETVISQETKPTTAQKTSKREFVPKVVQHIKPAALDRDSTFKEKIIEVINEVNLELKKELDEIQFLEKEISEYSKKSDEISAILTK